MNLAPLVAPAAVSDVSARTNREIVARMQKSEIYRTYEAAFQATTGLPLGLRAAGAFQSPLQSAKQANAFCRLMATANQSCAACLRLQDSVEAATGLGATTEECYAGLSESSVPIRLGETVVAHLQTGQVFMRPPTAARFRRAWRRLAELGLKVPRREIEQAYFASRVMTKPQYDSILRLLEIFALHLSALANQFAVMQATAEPPAVAKARSFIAEHQAEEISLSVVARAVNMSAFYFCKTFRRVTGVTFVDYVARVRVESVKQLLLEPNKRISEAAFEAGFQSLSQFNRVFQRVAGEAPTVYRQKLVREAGGLAAPAQARAAA